MKLLSICIPTYNRKKSLEKQIDYFLPFVEKHCDEVELIVSNNCSIDDTALYLESKKDCAFLTINNNAENIGLVGNLRVTTSKASGKFIWVVGDDDTILVGTADRVLNIIKSHPEVGHIFLNYTTGEPGKEANPVYSGKNEYFQNGFEMFSSITRRSTLGANMYISANIYLGERLKQANVAVDSCGETDNLSLPLGWSLFTSNFPGYIEDRISLVNPSADEVSWTDSKTRVFYRDQIAICDKLAQCMGIETDVNKLLIENMPSTYSAIKFAVLNNDEKLDNYASKWLWSNYKIAYIKDIVFFPFYSLKLAIIAIARNVIVMSRR